MPENLEPNAYPMLQEILKIKGLPIQATYTNGDIARIFDVSIRAIQDRIAAGQLCARDLPGRARFLSTDIEEFLTKSLRKKAK